MTALLTDNLPLLAGAPNGIKKLHELILELAVRGKLVPQDLSDEPASELLKRIAEEKARLTHEGKIKKQKLLAEIDEEEKPFELPEGWEWKRFGEIFSLEYGDNLPADKRSNTGEYPVYGSNGIVGTHNKCFVASPCIVVGRKGSAGALNLCIADGCCVTDVAYYCIPPSGCSLDYVFKLFHSLGLDTLGKGIKPGLNRNEAYELVVAIPPLLEQHRIVAKVDELMALCDRLEAKQADAESAHAQLVQALLDSLTQASDATDFAASWQRLAEHFHTLFTTEPSIDTLKQTLLQLAVMGKLAPQDPNDEPASKLLGRIVSDRQQLANEGLLKKQKNLTEISKEEKLFAIPQDWEWARISSFSELKSGLAYKSEAFSEAGNNQVIRMGNIRPGMLRLETNPAFISNDLARDTSDFSLVAGDIILTMTGTKGKQDYMYSVLIEEEHLEKNRLYLNQRLCAVRTQSINQKFLTLILQDKRLLDPIFRSSTGTANQANIGMSTLNNWALPIPPLAEQNRIVNAANQVMNICEALKIKINKSYKIHNLISSTLIVEGLA